MRIFFPICGLGASQERFELRKNGDSGTASLQGELFMIIFARKK